jgi:hypothetical protein
VKLTTKEGVAIEVRSFSVKYLGRLQDGSITDLRRWQALISIMGCPGEETVNLHLTEFEVGSLAKVLESMLVEMRTKSPVHDTEIV